MAVSVDDVLVGIHLSKTHRTSCMQFPRCDTDFGTKTINISISKSSFKENKQGFPGGSDGKESASSAGDPGSIPGYPLQYSCLEKSMGRGAWWATYSPWDHKQLHTTE